MFKSVKTFDSGSIVLRVPCRIHREVGGTIVVDEHEAVSGKPVTFPHQANIRSVHVHPECNRGIWVTFTRWNRLSNMWGMDAHGKYVRVDIKYEVPVSRTFTCKGLLYAERIVEVLADAGSSPVHVDEW